MSKQTTCIIFILCVVSAPCLGGLTSGNGRADLTEAMKDSVVYLEISTRGYDLSEPWKDRSLSESWACACAVGEYEVITTAESVSNLVFIKALRSGQNEFIGAKLKIVDCQTNLCLLQLDPNELSKPLKPLTFTEDYQRGAGVDCYWLSSDSTVYNTRGYLDRASVQKAPTSHGQHLRYIVADASQRTSAGEVYCIGPAARGVACRSSSNN